MSGVTGESTVLSQANMRGANLVGAVLHGADLFQADLVEADLSGADFAFSRLPAATLFNANHTETKFLGAIMTYNSVHPQPSPDRAMLSDPEDFIDLARPKWS